MGITPVFLTTIGIRHSFSYECLVNSFEASFSYRNGLGTSQSLQGLTNLDPSLLAGDSTLWD